jgi:hypothetical protein
MYHCTSMAFKINFKNTDFEALAIRELRLFLFSGVLLCSIAMYFISQRIYFDSIQLEMQKPYSQNKALLDQLKEEGLGLILSNPICQLNNRKVLDNSAIDCIEARLSPDSTRAVYQLLIWKGWKVESEQVLKDRFLNPTLVATLKEYQVQMADKLFPLEKARVDWLAYQLYTDRVTSKQIAKSNILILLIFFAVYPIRLARLWWKGQQNEQVLANDATRKWRS